MSTASNLVEHTVTQAPKQVQLQSAYPFGGGEGAALRQIARSLDANPNRPVDVQWTETYRDARVRRRACYLPASRSLHCERNAGDHYDYTPVTVAGIERALEAEGEDDAPALFADANLYSMTANELRSAN